MHDKAENKESQYIYKCKIRLIMSNKLKKIQNLLYLKYNFQRKINWLNDFNNKIQTVLLTGNLESLWQKTARAFETPKS